MRLLDTADSRLALEAITYYLPVSKPHSRATNSQLTVLAERLREGIAAETDEREQAFRAAAEEQYGRGGELEVDGNAIVSEGDDDGAYVQCWRWITCEEAGLPSKQVLESEEETSGHNAGGAAP